MLLLRLLTPLPLLRLPTNSGNKLNSEFETCPQCGAGLFLCLCLKFYVEKLVQTICSRVYI